MEIGENVENKSIHSVQSVPTFSSGEAESSQKEEPVRKTSKNRRVSFASSTQLAQYLEPINPFDSLGEMMLFDGGKERSFHVSIVRSSDFKFQRALETLPSVM